MAPRAVRRAPSAAGQMWPCGGVRGPERRCRWGKGVLEKRIVRISIPRRAKIVRRQGVRVAARAPERFGFIMCGWNGGAEE